MNALRCVDGVDWPTFEARTGLRREDVGVWSELAAAGLVREDRVAATDEGLRFLDGVLQRFLR